MKKLFLISMLSVFTLLPMSAQNRWGVMGGMGYSSTSAKDINGKLGGYVGGLYDIELNKSWYVQPQLLASYEANEAKNANTMGYKSFISRYSLTLPVLASYKFNLSDDWSMRINAGPYAQYALFGRDRRATVDGKGNTSSEMGWWHGSFGDRFTYGLKGGLSVEQSHFVLSVDCKYSLKKSALDFDGHGLTLSVGVGYKF
jgi:hypothetical protein